MQHQIKSTFDPAYFSADRKWCVGLLAGVSLSRIRLPRRAVPSQGNGRGLPMQDAESGPQQERGCCCCL